MSSPPTWAAVQLAVRTLAQRGVSSVSEQPMFHLAVLENVDYAATHPLETSDVLTSIRQQRRQLVGLCKQMPDEFLDDRKVVVDFDVVRDFVGRRLNRSPNRYDG